MTATDDGLDHGSLERWLAAALPGDAATVRVDGFAQPKSGFSAETVIFDAHFDRDGAPHTERLVLRRETKAPADHAVYPQQAPGLDVEVDIQYRAMRAVAAAAPGVPMAPLIGYEADASVLGAPFFVMGFVGGEVPVESPPYPAEGFFVDASPATRRQMVVDGLGVLAACTRSTGERRISAGWSRRASSRARNASCRCGRSTRGASLGDREIPILDRGLAWLHERLPDSVAADRPVGICWGDARPGNMIWQDGRCACVTDWEAVSIASPDQDLGWWLMFDRWIHESWGIAHLDGEPSRDEQRALYAAAAGCAVPDTTFHEVFAAARYCAIVVRVMNRAVERGLMPADHTIWLDNPSTICLADLLDEHA